MTTTRSTPNEQRRVADVELAQELLRANREIASLRERLRRTESRADGFVRMVHEIRTLLGAVTGLSTILLDGELVGEQREHVKHIRASGAALLEVVNGVLDFSKLEAGALAVEAVPFDLRAKLEDVAALAAERASSKGLELAVCLDDDVPTAVRGDAVRLRQTLLNLVINAIKFTDRGSVVLRARLSPAHAPADPNRERVIVRLEVTDTGSGIAPASVAQIFEPFQQGGAASNRDGTGLGLAIVRGFAEAMGGSVSCASELGVGSCFTVAIPLAVREDANPAGASAATGAVARTDAAAPHRVLVVEGLPCAREDLARGLDRSGFSVEVAATPEEASELVRARRAAGAPFDAILCGVPPGKADWVDAAMTLGEYAPEAKLVVATPFNLRLPSKLAARAWTHLYKPYRRARIVAALRTALDATQQRPEMTSLGTSKMPLLEQGAFSKLSALVVEDEAINARITRHLLERRGWSVDHAVDGQEAVEHCARRSYDLVLLDWHTPRLDGLAAAREIRAREAPGQRMALVALTAVGNEGAREQCLAAGMDDFLTKPIIHAALDSVLSRVVSGAYAWRATPTPPPPPPPILDAETLEALRASADPGALREFVEIFARSAPERFAELSASVIDDDAEAATIAAHTLRRMCAQMGVTQVTERLLDVELHAKATELRTIAPAIEAIGRDLGRAVEALRAELE